MLEIIRPDVTFHLAAVANVGFAWKNPELTYDVNFMGTSNLLEALQASAPDSRLVLMSSAEIYQPSERPIGEKDPVVCQQPLRPFQAGHGNAGRPVLAGLRHEGLQDTGLQFHRPRPGQEIRGRGFRQPDRQDRKGGTACRSSASATWTRSATFPTSATWPAACRPSAPGAGAAKCSMSVRGGSIPSRQILDILLAQAQTPIRVEVDRERVAPAGQPA